MFCIKSQILRDWILTWHCQQTATVSPADNDKINSFRIILFLWRHPVMSYPFYSSIFQLRKQDNECSGKFKNCWNITKTKCAYKWTSRKTTVWKKWGETQSAYWNPESVILHPVVMYYSDNGSVEHSSMVVVSEVLNHNSSMLTAILNKVTNFVKDTCPKAKFVYYWTDSPTSQYRNKTMFDIVARHENLCGLTASWQFFECGHGKGAYDSIGRVVKRSADTAIKTGKENITCGRDSYEWWSKTDCKVRYEFVEKPEYDDAAQQVEERQKQINPVKGTLKLHSVACISEHEVMVRDTTCVCANCFNENWFVWSDTNSCGWRKHKLKNTHISKKS